MSDIDFTALIGPVAKRLWGDPNRAQSKRHELRWGTNGSKSVNLFKGTFFDHEENIGGGVLELIKRERGLADGDAVAWLPATARRHIEAQPRRRAPTDHLYRQPRLFA